MTDKRLRIESWSIDKVKPYELNAKEHPPEQIETLARAIQRFGWDQPVVIEPDGTIIKGHGRRLAAISLGLKEVPVLIRHDLTKDEAKAARLSDNRVTSTLYDTDMLKQELAALQLSTDIDMTSVGFTAKELEFLIDDIGVIDEGAFVEDVGAAVESQKDANAAKVAEIDKSEMSVTDALGFKRVPPELSRRIKAFIAKLETETGLKGGAALGEFLAEMGID